MDLILTALIITAIGTIIKAFIVKNDQLSTAYFIIALAYMIAAACIFWFIL